MTTMRSSKALDWECLAKTEMHPLRLSILRALALLPPNEERSPKELSEFLDERLGNVSYHVRILAASGLIKLVRTVPRRGAMEHYYRVTPKALGK